MPKQRQREPLEADLWEEAAIEADKALVAADGCRLAALEGHVEALAHLVRDLRALAASRRMRGHD